MQLVQHTYIVTNFYKAIIVLNLLHIGYLYNLYYSIKYSQHPHEVGTY